MTDDSDDTGEGGGPGAGGTAGTLSLWMLVGTVVAPTSLVTALLYYFGWHHAYWFFDYFGVNSTVLGLGTVDYLMRALDALFVPMTVTAAAGLLAFWGHDLLRKRIAAGVRPQLLKVLPPVTAAVGFLLALGGFWSVFARTFLSDHLVAAPLSLAIGVTLLAYALQLRRTTASTAATEPAQDETARPPWAGLAEGAVVFVLVGLGLFWAANDYAAAVGESRAREFVAGLPTYPSAVLYSKNSLSLTAPGVRETRCHDRGADGAAYRFRYDGLKLMLRSGNEYVFVPERWTRNDGVAVLIPRTDSVRLEFAPPSASGAGRSSPPEC